MYNLFNIYTQITIIKTYNFITPSEICLLYIRNNHRIIRNIIYTQEVK